MADYISREAVLRAFKLIAKNPNKDYQRGMQDTIECLVPQVIADIPAADVYDVHGQWVSVKDRLPATRKTVLIYDEYEGVSAGYYDSYYAKFRSIEDIYRSCNVTHWQPLPEPPKGGENR